MRNKRDDISVTSTNQYPDIGFTFNELAKELAAEQDGIQMQDNDVTSMMMAEVWNVNQSTARRRLSQLVKTGKLMCVGKTIIHGAWTNVYRKKI